MPASELFDKYRASHTLLYLPVSGESINTIAAKQPPMPKAPAPASHDAGLPDATLTAEPEVVDFGDLSSWGDVVFRYENPKAHNVHLVGDFTQWRPIPMKRQDAIFTALLALEDGRYLYRFVVDGRDMLDPQSPHRVSVTAHGVSSVLQLRRWQRTVQMANRTKKPLTLQVQPSHTWLHVIPSALTLPSQGVADLVLELQRAEMTPGPHAARVELLSSHQTNAVATVEVGVHWLQDTLVVQPLHDAIDLGPCIRGERVQVPLDFEVFGRGEQEVLIYSHTDATLHRVRVQGTPDGSPRRQQCSIPLRLGTLPRRARGTCLLSLDTQCALWNRRFYSVRLNYQLLFLQKRPSQLHFHHFNAVGTRRLTLHIRRSDGIRPDVAVEIPSALKGRLTARQAAIDTWQFSVRCKDFTPSETVEGLVHLTDRKSGSVDHIRVIVEVNA